MGGASAGRSSGAVSAIERCSASRRGPVCGLRPVCSASIWYIGLPATPAAGAAVGRTGTTDGDGWAATAGAADGDGAGDAAGLAAGAAAAGDTEATGAMAGAVVGGWAGAAVGAVAGGGAEL